MLKIVCFIVLVPQILQIIASPTNRTDIKNGDEYIDITDSHAHSMADDIELHFNMEGHPMTLNLHRNKGINMDIPIVCGGKQSKNVHLRGVASEKSMYVYNDPEKEASVIVDMAYGTKHYSGQFYVNDVEYKLKPVHIAADLPSSPYNQSGSIPVKHVVSKVKQEQSASIKENKFYESMHVSEWANASGMQNDVPAGRASQNLQGDNKIADYGKTYDVEILFVIDYSIYREWYLLSDEPTEEGRMKEAIQNIQFYFTHIANGVSMRYSSINDPLFKIRTTLSGFYIATERDAAPFTRDHLINSDPKNTVDGDPTMKHLQGWLFENKGDLPPFDQATLFIDHYLKGWSGNKILGMAIIEGVCTQYGTAISREIGQYATIQTLSHELGHSLGAFHDGNHNECKGSDQFIMASYPTTLTTANFGNTFKFSACSINYFKGFFAYMDRENYNCLENPGYPAHNNTSILTTLPGQQYTPDQQCVLIFGPGAFYCGGNTEDRNICFRMECFSPAARRCVVDTEQRAASGTTCGNKKWCEQGVCTYNNKAPKALVNCTYGDYTGPYTNGLSCKKIGNEEPWHCYNSYYLDDCCKTCSDIKDKSKPDCAYGDMAASCANITISQCDNSTIREACCKTCQNFTTDCMNNDYSWCSTYIKSGSVCYHEAKSCCKACRKYKTNAEGCKYGDYVTWCDNYIKQGRHCYIEGQRCCQTCQKYNITGIKECPYGDRVSNCNKNQCNSPQIKQKCCLTCAEKKITTSSTTTTTTTSPTTTTRTTTTTTKPTTTTTIPTSTTTSTTTMKPTTTSTTVQSTTTTSKLPADGDTCLDTQSWCSDLKANSCYDTIIRTLCCAKCTSYKRPVKGCEYGDYFTWCAKQYCTYTAQRELYNKCCETCWPKTDCDDKADWCLSSTFHSSYCYDTTIGQDTCCKKCRGLYRENQKGCEYGDKRTWCSSKWCPKERETCCQSCNYYG